MRCSHCQTRGATIGCRVERCSHSFHLHCARAAGCTFYPAQFVVACTTHAPAFKEEAEQDGALPESPCNPVRRRPSQQGGRVQTKGKRGRRAEEIKEYIQTARAAHKRARMEMRQESESSDDEEHFQRKEEKRLERDKAKLNPVILRRPQPGEQSSMPGWESLGGLQHVVEQLKEMVILPLLYPELFSHMRISPPRGILFHGEPGTGKTLAARALAGACARASPKPVAFFARKGADCLGKFSGEAERTLRLLFEEAAAQAPAIIFLDELDGLVPARGQAGSGGSDQIYASVVSTMLALMDGVADRGAVVVIGATNRPEAIDAALRRPGRFDREVYFGLPSTADRLEILSVHTCRWEPPPSIQLLQAVAAATQGFAGADLQALCAGAVMAAVNRTAPALLHKLEQQAMSAQASGTPDGPSLMTDCGMVGASGQPSLSQEEGQAPRTRASARQLAAEDSASGAPEPGDGQAQPQQAALQPHAAGSSAASCDARAQADAHTVPGDANGSMDTETVLSGVHVRASDWREALAAAPEPCSRRQGLASLAADAAAPMQALLAPALLPSLAAALRVLHASGLPLPTAAASAASLAEVSIARSLEARDPPDAGANAGQGDVWEELRTRLVQAGALKAAEHVIASGAVQHGVVEDGQLQPAAPTPPVLPKSAAADPDVRGPFRVLLAGVGERGQPQVAGALLQLLGSSVNLAAVSLAQIVIAGCGDSALGCISTVRQAAQRAAPGQLTVLFLPRIDGWAVTRTLVDPLEAGAAECASPEAPAYRNSSRLANGSAAAAVSSPFRGLVSLEARGNESPSRAWRAQMSPRPATPSRLSAGFSPIASPGCSSMPLANDLDFPLVGRRLSGMLDAQGGGINTAENAGGREASDQNGAVQPTACESISAAADGASMGIEAVCVSELWMVFEQTVREVPPSNPVLILATSHCRPAELPPLLISFFSTSSAVGNQRHAADSVIILEDELPVRELHPAETSIEHLLQRRKATACSSGMTAKDVPAVRKENAASAGPLVSLPVFNAAERERGQQILQQVEDGIRWCGQALVKKCSAISAKILLSAEAPPGTSLAAVAEAASHGGYNTLQEFQAAFHNAARWHCDARNRLEADSPTQMTAVAALRDQVDCWCYGIKSAVKLNDPDILRLIQATTSS